MTCQARGHPFSSLGETKKKLQRHSTYFSPPFWKNGSRPMMGSSSSLMAKPFSEKLENLLVNMAFTMVGSRTKSRGAVKLYPPKNAFFANLLLKNRKYYTYIHLINLSPTLFQPLSTKSSELSDIG